ATPPPPTVLDVVGIHPAQPEGVVAEMRPHEEAPPAVGIIPVGQERGERVVYLVVGCTDALCVVAHAEVHQYRRDVIGEATILLADAPEGMTHHHTEEQGKGGASTGA